MSRPVGVNLKQDQRAKITELYLSGISSSAIAKQLGVAKSTVTRHTLREGLREKLETAGKRLSELEISQIKEWYSNTLLPKEYIADQLGVSVDSINYHTEGLGREIPKDKLIDLASLYLAGEITADEIKESTGMNKHDFYSVVKQHIKGEL